MKHIITLVLLFIIGTFVFGQQKTIKVELVNRIITLETTYQNGKETQVVKKDYGYSEVNRQLLFLVNYRLGLHRFKIVDNDTQTADYRLVIDSGLDASSAITIIMFTDLKSGKTTQKIFGDFNPNDFSHRLWANSDEHSKKIVKYIEEQLKSKLPSIFYFSKKIEDEKFVFVTESTPVQNLAGQIGKVIGTVGEKDRGELIGYNADDLNSDNANDIWLNVKFGTVSGFINAKYLMDK